MDRRGLDSRLRGNGEWSMGKPANLERHRQFRRQGSNEVGVGPGSGASHIADALRGGDWGEAAVSHAGVKGRISASRETQGADLLGITIPVEGLDNAMGGGEREGLIDEAGDRGHGTNRRPARS